MIPSTFQRAIILAVGAAFSFASTGCRHYYRYLPGPVEQAAAEKAGLDPWKFNWKDLTNRAPESFTVTDRHAVIFAAQVRDLLRKKATVSRIARETSATAQVLAAAAAATLGAVSGGSSKAVVILAGSAAVIPNLQEIFTAKERAEAYNQGANLVAEAESRFQAARAGEVDATRLSLAGAKLIEEIVAALRLVETAIISQIPDIADVQKARGIRPQTLSVSTDALEIRSGAAGEVGVVGDSAIQMIASANTEVADVSRITNETRRVSIRAKDAGLTRVTLSSGAGLRADVLVDVPFQISPAAEHQTYRLAKSASLTLNVSNSSHSPVTFVNLTPDFLHMDLKPNMTSVQLRGKAKGSGVIKIANDFGARRTVKIDVVD